MPKKLTPRQVAGRRNRKKRKGITLAGKDTLRQAALNNRPWEHSTGPRTLEGKRRSRENAWKHGGRAWATMPEEFQTIARSIRDAEEGRGAVQGDGMEYLAASMAQGDNLALFARYATLMARWQRAYLGRVKT